MSRFAHCLVLLTIAGYVLAQNEWNCNKEDEDKVDQLVARIMTYGRADRKYPSNKRELTSYCKEQTNMLSKIETYKNKCLKGQSKQLVSVIVYSIKQLIKTYCRNSNSKRTKELLESAPCANKASMEYNKCSVEYIDRLFAIADWRDSKKQLAQVCCGYLRIPQCVREKAAQFPDICSDSSTEGNVNYIRGFFDNAIDTICGEYNEQTDKCDKVRNAAAKKKKTSTRYPESFFHPLVKVLSNF